MYNKCLILLSIVFCFSFSCIREQRHYIHGKAELVGIYDTLLSDSSIIYGNIYSSDSLIMFSFSGGEYIIKLMSTHYYTVNDASGSYTLKIVPSIYSIQCKNLTYGIIREEINNIKIGPNQKAKIDFYIGFVPV